MINIPNHIPDVARIRILLAMMVALLLSIIARLWYLQIVNGTEYAQQSETQRTRVIRRVAERGVILDSKGRVLAASRPHYVVSVLPDALKKNPEVLSRLAQMLHTSVDDLSALIDQNKTTPFDPVPVSSDVDMSLLSQIEEQRVDLPGVLIEKDPMRDYRDNETCTHVLGVARPISEQKLEQLRSKGYRGGDMLGVEGLEASYESDLRGKDGGQKIEVDALGRMRHNLDIVPPEPGHTLHLTLDKDLQQVAYDSLKEELDQGHAGAAVAMDPRNGAVLAFVSTPSYDLNRFGPDYNKIKDTPNFPLLNRVSRSTYPNGSTFKLITTAAGMESDVLFPNSTDYCSGSLKMGSRIFHCDKRSGHGSLDLTRAIGASCDVYFWHVAQRVGQSKMTQWAHNFGLGSKTGIDLPASEDAHGIVPSPEWKRKRFKRREDAAWVPGDLINMAIGQGFVGVTPLQLVDYTAAIANGGTLWRPQLVHEITRHSQGREITIRRLQAEPRGNLGIRQSTRDAITAGMVRAMEPGGTAASSSIPGLTIAGKTGTAETISHGNKVDNSVFTCFAPVDNPQIAVSVLVEGGGHGSTAAAPIARRILARFFNLHIQNTPIGTLKSGGVD